MSKARELIEAANEALEEIHTIDESKIDVNENKLVYAHDSHKGRESAVGYVMKVKSSGAHKAVHIAYPNSMNNPRDLGNHPSHEEAAEAIKKAHQEFENHPKYKHWYKK